MRIEIEDYEDAATGELLSIFELQGSLYSRDELSTLILTPTEQKQLAQLDRAFLDRASEVRKLIGEYGNADKIFLDQPPEHWWWHIPRIATGDMQVDLDKRTVNYNGTEYSY